VVGAAEDEIFTLRKATWLPRNFTLRKEQMLAFKNFSVKIQKETKQLSSK